MKELSYKLKSTKVDKLVKLIEKYGYARYEDASFDSTYEE